MLTKPYANNINKVFCVLFMIKIRSDWRFLTLQIIDEGNIHFLQADYLLCMCTSLHLSLLELSPLSPSDFFSFQTKMNRDEPGFIPTLQGSISSSKVIHTHFFFLSFYCGILGEKLKFKIFCSCITAVANTF